MKPNLRDKIEQNLRKMAFPEITQNLFAFSYKLNIQQSEKDGWKVFNIFEEFLRQVSDDLFNFFLQIKFIFLFQKASGFYSLENVRY